MPELNKVLKNRVLFYCCWSKQNNEQWLF